MKLTFNSGIINPAFGFGNASFNIFMTLKRLGYDVKYNDLSRDFQIAFSTPAVYHSLFSVRAKKRIGYMAWESSKPLTSGWMYGLNFCHEMWVPSSCNVKYLREWGYEGEIKKFPHGVYSAYQPASRHTSRLDIVNFGFPGVRKNAKQLFEWFADSEYANKEDVSLTFKVYEDAAEKAEELFKGVNNVNIVARNFTIEENVRFMNRFNLHVYPSLGEGFGLMPLETMATGMPTIVPSGGWCDFDYVQPTLTVPSWEGEVNDPLIKRFHPGKMFLLNMDDVGDKIRYVGDNLESVVDMAYERASIVQQDFNWENLVKTQFDPYKDLLD